jgi:MinD-like ATPase involved in chromosome partitioning or flagellar assembly
MAQIWPIGGGKGGTGKSFLTGNIGILLARQRFKTLLIDADLGAANLHTIVGFPIRIEASPISLTKEFRHLRKRFSKHRSPIFF